jgi:D-serine deaminase-like pyridoxal phosphate-dependent protein
MMLHAGITKFKCATIAEAEMLGTLAAPDVLLAYQPLGPKLERFVRLVKKFPQTKFSCLTDNMEAAIEQDKSFSSNGLQVEVYVDLNVGMNRTGIAPGEEAFKICKFSSTATGIRLGGLHVYDGHVRDANFSIRKKQSDEAFATAQKMREQLGEAGIKISNVIAGGSPTFPIHAMRTNVECSPGTFVYWDKTYIDQCPEQNFIPAALVLTRVISIPARGKLCTDLGHKSIAAENDLDHRVFFLNATDLKAVSHSEEHFVLQTSEVHPFKTGDVLYGLPYHICPTIALYERAIIIENAKAVGEWKNIARDRKITV